MVDAVLRSRIGRILRRSQISRICMKQEREIWVMWSEKLRFWSKITSKFRTGEVGVNAWVDVEPRLKEIDGSGIFFSCSRRPMTINSVFEGLRQRRFEVVQEEICLTTSRRWSTCAAAPTEQLLGTVYNVKESILEEWLLMATTVYRFYT